jgi:hypothetical protein
VDLVDMVEKVEADTQAPPPRDGEAEAEAGAAEEGESDAAEAETESVSELIEEAGRAASVLALREAQLVAARHGPQLRQVARDVLVGLGIGAAFLTAFALANWAAVNALSGPLPDWAAPLVLAGIWIVIGILLLVFLLIRADRVFGWKWWQAFGGDDAQALVAREAARDEAEQAMRDSLERLAGGVGAQAGVLVAAAVVPMASGVVGAGEDIIEEIDEFTDDIVEAVPGGGVINWAADVALIPGRAVVRVARFALKR